MSKPKRILFFCVLSTALSWFCAFGSVFQNKKYQTIDFETNEVTKAEIALSPDGDWMIFTMLGHLFRLPVEGGTAEQLTFGSNRNSQPAISPDGKQIAFISDRDGGEGNVFLMELKTKELHQVTYESWAARP